MHRCGIINLLIAYQIIAFLFPRGSAGIRSQADPQGVFKKSHIAAELELHLLFIVDQG